MAGIFGSKKKGNDVTWFAGNEPATDTHAPLRQALHELQESKKGGLRGMLGLETQNSEKFQGVTSAIEPVLRMGQGQVGSSREEVRQNLGNALPLYGNLLDACQNYLARRAETYNGKQRQMQVAKIMDLAMKDMDGIKATIDQMGSMQEEDLTALTWQQVFQHSRELVIRLEDTAFEDIKHTGADSSDVLMLDNGQGGYNFFKRNETLYQLGGNNNGTLNRDVTKKEGARQLADEMHLSGRSRKILKKYNYNYAEIPDDPEELMELCKNDEATFDQMTRFLKFANQRYGNLDGAMTSISILGDKGRLRLQDTKVNVTRRNVATSRIAELLGVSDLIAGSQTARIIDKTGMEVSGNLMAGAKGIGEGKTLTEKTFAGTTIPEIIARHAESGTEESVVEEIMGHQTSGSLQKSMTSLQVLDALCAQTDRHSGNYFIQVGENNTVTGVQGIDNDLSFGLRSADFDVNRSALGMETDRNNEKGRAVLWGGKIELPHVDATLARNILNLRDDVARYALCDLLTEEEIDWFLTRLHELQEAFQNEMRKPDSNVFIENDSDWNEETHKDLMAQDEAKALSFYGMAPGKYAWDFKNQKEFAEANQLPIADAQAMAMFRGTATNYYSDFMNAMRRNILYKYKSEKERLENEKQAAKA